jgi:hypothetical protein
MMNEQDNKLDPLIGRIRAASEGGRLCPLLELASLFGDQPGAGVDALAEARALLAEGAPEDIKFMQGALDGYFFSEASMTSAYAIHLFRLAERDPVRLIADTTRDESRLYPRPTLLDTFLLQPFFMAQADLDAALETLLASEEYQDIRSVSASNGERFLYSLKYLSPGHAEALAEWAAVGEKENP